MSYNISAWKIRKIHLELPINFDFRQWLLTLPDKRKSGTECYGKRWCLEDKDSAILVDLAAKTWTLNAMMEEITGVIEDNKLVATGLEWTGDFSGHLYSDVLLPLFKEFNGTLDAIVVWEGGDTIEQLNIHDGIVKSEEIS